VDVERSRDILSYSFDAYFAINLSSLLLKMFNRMCSYSTFVSLMYVAGGWGRSCEAPGLKISLVS